MISSIVIAVNQSYPRHRASELYICSEAKVAKHYSPPLGQRGRTVEFIALSHNFPSQSDINMLPSSALMSTLSGANKQASASAPASPGANNEASVPATSSPGLAAIKSSLANAAINMQNLSNKNPNYKDEKLSKEMVGL